jgi:hypothetical protein
MEIRIIEKIENYSELPRLIFLLSLTILIIPAFMIDLLSSYIFMVSIGFLMYCFWKFYQYKDTSNWNKKEARITDYQIVCLKKTDCESKVSTCNYVVQLSYEYRINHNKYKSNTIAIDKSLYSFGDKKDKAIEYLANFLNKPIVHIYVNPKKKNVSVLDASISNQTLFDCMLCLILSIASLIAIGYFS